MTDRPSSAPWRLAIDFGTTATVAAVIGADGRGDLVDFGRTTRLPSGVFVHADDGLLAGQLAANQAGADPARYIRTPKRHVGRDEHVRVGGVDVGVSELVAATLRAAASAAVKSAGGSAPETVVLTHPAMWAAASTAQLRAAAELAGLADAVLVAEPVAAGFAAAKTTADGAYVAVYDLGGGTFDAAVLQRAGGSWRLAGRPGGLATTGGERFDTLLHESLLERIAADDPSAAEVLRAPSTRVERGFARTWWRDVRSVKEGLSEVSSLPITVPMSGAELLVTRDELEELVAPSLAETVAVLHETVRDAGIEASALAEIVLSGDASLMPAVSRQIAEAFDAEPTVAHDSKAVVALGALPAVSGGSASVASSSSPVPAEPGPRETARERATARWGATASGPELARWPLTIEVSISALEAVVRQAGFADARPSIEQMLAVARVPGEPSRYVGIREEPGPLQLGDPATIARDPLGYFKAQLDMQVETAEVVDAYGTAAWFVDGPGESRVFASGETTSRTLFVGATDDWYRRSIASVNAEQTPGEVDLLRYGFSVDLLVPGVFSEREAVVGVTWRSGEQGVAWITATDGVESEDRSADDVLARMEAELRAQDATCVVGERRREQLLGGLPGVVSTVSSRAAVAVAAVVELTPRRFVRIEAGRLAPRANPLRKPPPPWELCRDFLPNVLLRKDQRR